MIRLVAIATFVLATSALAAPAPSAAPAPLQGEVLETRDVDSYTYLRLKTAGGEVWAAVPTTAAKKGSQVTIANPMTMENFDSKTLGKHFDRIVFGQIAPPGAPTTSGAAPTAALAGVAPSASPHGSMTAAAAPLPAIKVAKASGPDAKTVAEVVKGKAALKDKTVLVRGQVVKVNKGIMGKNWLHLRDGSGAVADGSNDVIVTTKDAVAVGDVVDVRGTVRTNVELGAGYAYAVLIDDAALRK